jgi:two-component system OmpR family response regulator
MHLLIVDDDLEFSQSLRKTLSDFGKISVAADFNSARKILATDKIDLLISDYFLPDGNGLALIQDAKSLYAQQKSILMSGATTKEIAIASVNSQITALIEKPFTGSEIKKIINHIIDVKFIELNEKDHKIKIQDLCFSLTPTEFKIFKYLFENSDKRISRKQIADKIWGSVEISDNVFDTHLGNIKKKMGPHSGMLSNIKGVGYSLEINVDKMMN